MGDDEALGYLPPGPLSHSDAALLYGGVEAFLPQAAGPRGGRVDDPRDSASSEQAQQRPWFAAGGPRAWSTGGTSASSMRLQHAPSLHGGQPVAEIELRQPSSPAIGHGEQGL